MKPAQPRLMLPGRTSTALSASKNAACPASVPSPARAGREQPRGARPANMTVSKYVVDWLSRKRFETSAVTFAAYKYVTHEFTAFLGSGAVRPLRCTTPAQLIVWRDHSAFKTTPHTANNKLKIVRALFQTAWRDGLIGTNPAANVPPLEVRKTYSRSFTMDELMAIWRVASREWRGMILIGLCTDRRLKEIALLTTADVDVTRGVIRIARSRTGQPQFIPIPVSLCDYFGKQSVGADPRVPLFPSAHQIATENCDTSPLSQQFHDLLVAVGLSQPRPRHHGTTGVGRSGRRMRNGVSFNSLRRTGRLVEFGSRQHQNDARVTHGILSRFAQKDLPRICQQPCFCLVFAALPCIFSLVLTHS